MLLAGRVAAPGAEPVTPPTLAEPAFELLGFEGRVEVQDSDQSPWVPGVPGQRLPPGGALSTARHSRATLRASNQTVFRLGELSVLQVPTREAPGAEFNLLRGLLYFFHRGAPRDLRIRTPLASAVVRGTEFAITVDSKATVTVDLIDGVITLASEAGTLEMTPGDRAIAERGKAPRRIGAWVLGRTVQWALYYPLILDPAEISLPGNTSDPLARAYAAYRDGDLATAVGALPDTPAGSSADERLFHAAVALAAGQTAEAESIHFEPPVGADLRVSSLARALDKLVRLVRGEEPSPGIDPPTATESLADSYLWQSRLDLVAARAAAWRATQLSPGYAIAWARLADLELSRGDARAARLAVERSLGLAPRNAHAHALRGFLLANAGHPREALAAFERALALDVSLPLGWLGRGLARFRRGDVTRALQDLEVATLLDPRNASFRSQLGRAYGGIGDVPFANRELDLAQALDPADPTPRFHRALLHRSGNRVNEAIGELEESLALNENRAVYRSRGLLAQDRAVRGANLAGIYQDAGLDEPALGEAIRAVSADYASPSAHLFLANAYDAVRDPNQINLRFETPWLSEYLVANLLAPVEAGVFSPTLSLQETSRLLERDGVGFVSSTEYLDRGEWIQRSGQSATVHGRVALGLEQYYRTTPGQRENADREDWNLALHARVQAGPSDVLYARLSAGRSQSGDVLQYGGTSTPNPRLRTHEFQDPLLLFGGRHDWGPEHLTLFLAGWLADRYRVDQPGETLLLGAAGPDGLDLFAATADAVYSSDAGIGSIEGQHVWHTERNTLIAGARFQAGVFDSAARQTVTTPVTVGPLTLQPDLFGTAVQEAETHFERFAAYGYEQVRLRTDLVLEVGITYENVFAPSNLRFPPISDTQQRVERVLPKVGCIWTPGSGTTLRMGLAQALGGVSAEQSLRLEPSQVAGFSQAFRGLIPETLAGTQTTPEHRIAGVALQQRWRTRTYAGIALDWLEAENRQDIGYLHIDFPPFDASPSAIPRQLDFVERTLSLYMGQLLGDTWSTGARYRWSVARLEQDFPAVSRVVAPVTDLEAALHHFTAFVRFHHASGWFAGAEVHGYHQETEGLPATPGESSYWQVHVSAGYRFWKRRAELRVSGLNLTDTDPRLHPLNLHFELPRDPTLAVRLRLEF